MQKKTKFNQKVRACTSTLNPSSYLPRLKNLLCEARNIAQRRAAKWLMAVNTNGKAPGVYLGNIFVHWGLAF